MRKILVSPGFGAGWTSWNSHGVAKVMIDYAPIVEFLESGGKFTDADFHPNNGKAIHPLLQRLVDDVRKATGNPEEYVCLLGADDLVVRHADGPVKIYEYDGNESLEPWGESEDWL